jgi:hypothetical protein
MGHFFGMQKHSATALAFLGATGTTGPVALACHGAVALTARPEWGVGV